MLVSLKCFSKVNYTRRNELEVNNISVSFRIPAPEWITASLNEIVCNKYDNSISFNYSSA